MGTRFLTVLCLLGTVVPAHAALVISHSPSSNVTCVSGTCTATAADAMLNIKDVKQLLKAGDLKIASGSVAQDIAFNIKLNWTSAHRLTLDAFRSITFNEAVTAEGTGAVTLITNDGGTGGDYAFVNKGKLAFWDTSSSLIINGTSFTLVNDIHSLAAGIAANPSGAFALAKFYDASVDGTYQNSPVPTTFNGTFTGLGHTLQNVHIRLLKGGAFFALIGTGTVRDVAFTQARILSDEPSGGVVAYVNEGTISNVTSDAIIVVKGHGSVAGGFVLDNEGVIQNCSASGSVSALDHQGQAGGFAVDNNGTILKSHAANTVLASDAIAGFVLGNTGAISFSSSSGDVTAGVYSNEGAPLTAGFVATNSGVIDQSFSTVTVVGGDNRTRHKTRYVAFTGGFVATQYGDGAVTNSYSLSPTSAGKKAFVGGFVASGGSASTSYSTSQVSIPSGRFLFGFGAVPSSANDYWNIDTSGTSQGCGAGCTGITGLTDAQLKSALPAGFDPAIWGQSPGINNGYPYLLANPPQ